MSEANTSTTPSSGLTAGVILGRLQQKVSIVNARILLDTAKTQTGLQVVHDDTVLDSEQAKSLCLKLINNGGPSFHVGQALYKEFLM
jgi:hypothetical protein